MKTLLHIIDTTGPGGAETVFIDLISHLPTDKYRSIVVIRGKGWVYEELCRRGIEPILLDAKGSFNWRYLRQLVQLIRKENVSLIQSHLLGSNVYCALAGMLSRTPVVATFHGAVDVAEQERFSGLKFAAINMGASAIVAVSKDLRDNIVKRTSLSTKKTCIIYNGINTREFERASSKRLREQFGWSEDDIIVGCLGNIRPAKAYDILLEVAAIVQRSDSRIRFVVAGHEKKGLFDALLSQRATLQLEEQVKFIGFCDDPGEFLSNLDVFLLTSRSEGFSIATIQAMAAQLPVIATRSGGPQEILTHQVNGLLVEPEQAAGLAEAIESLVNDTELVKSLALAGKEHAIKSFDIASMIDAYMALYNKLIK